MKYSNIELLTRSYVSLEAFWTRWKQRLPAHLLLESGEQQWNSIVSQVSRRQQSMSKQCKIKPRHTIVIVNFTRTIFQIFVQNFIRIIARSQEQLYANFQNT